MEKWYTEGYERGEQNWRRDDRHIMLAVLFLSRGLFLLMGFMHRNISGNKRSKPYFVMNLVDSSQASTIPGNCLTLSTTRRRKKSDSGWKRGVVSGGAGGTGLNMPLYAAGMLFEQHMRRRRGMIPRHHRRKSLHLTLGIRRSCVYDLAGSERRAKFHP